MITTLKLSADLLMAALILASWPAFKMTHSRRAHALILSVLFVTLGLVASCCAASVN